MSGFFRQAAKGWSICVPDQSVLAMATALMLTATSSMETMAMGTRKARKGRTVTSAVLAMPVLPAIPTRMAMMMAMNKSIMMGTPMTKSRVIVQMALPMFVHHPHH